MNAFHFSGVSRRGLALAVVVAGLAGCANHSVVSALPIDPAELPLLIANSPHARPLTRTQFAARTEATGVALYYYAFHAFNEPSGLKDWKRHYVIAPESSPDWSFDKLAEVIVYQRSMEDVSARQTMASVAANLGGDAVIDLYRKPVVTRRIPAPIEAYLYYGVVVRRR